MFKNKINGKVYIGKTINWKGRVLGHKSSAKNPKYHFGRALRKYGWDNFERIRLVDDVPEEKLPELEKKYIKLHNSKNPAFGYNLTEGGEGMSGYEFTTEQRQAMSHSHIKNHTVEGGGSICFNKASNKWQVRSKRNHEDKTDGITIGSYYTQETAAKALLLYNTTGERRPSDVIFRRIGTIKERNGRFRGVYQNLSVGTFATEELAQAALDKRIEQVANGVVFVPKKRKYGTIQKQKNGKFRPQYKRKYLGTYDSEAEAEAAIKKCIDRGTVFVSKKRKYGTIWKTKNGRFGGRYKRKNVGTYDSEAEVEAAIKKCIENKSL